MELYSQKINRLSQLIAFSFILQILISWKLWLPIGREFPLMSAFEWLDFSIGIIGDGMLFLVLLVSLAFIIVNKYRNLAIIITISCLFVLILEDISRFQHWVYTQTIILVLISFYKKGREKAILSGVLLVVALVYMWCGIQKLNLGFLRETFPWILSAFKLDFKINSGQQLGTINYLFIIVGLLEFTIGLFLLISKTRKIGIIAGIIMHLFILLCLGPIGHNSNIIVWPWNLSLIMLLILFYKSEMCVNILDGIKSFWFNYIIFILLGVMPVFNFIGYWDDTLSGSMYSGTHSNVVFYFDPYNEPELPKFRQYATVVKEKSDSESLFYKTWFYTWSIYDIKVPVYQADRYYKRYGKVLCENVKEPLASGIEITTRSKFSGHQIITKCSCLELLSAND